jgi:hypothetical protein
MLSRDAMQKVTIILSVIGWTWCGLVAIFLTWKLRTKS